jgi:hypothetical protein
MNPLFHSTNAGAFIAMVSFYAAFVLTLWPNRTRALMAAILYAVGTWFSLGILAWNYSNMVRIGYGASDSGLPNTAALFWLLLPIMTVVYALAAPALLWPSIPQAVAMRYGKILHLALIPLLAIVMIASIYVSTHGYYQSDQLKWLVYGLMWFRIRESYRDDCASKTQ